MSWTQKQIDDVWGKAETTGQENEKKGFRKDQCTAWINKAKYGDRQSKHGWEIDHIKPKSKGGSDNLSNLRPLHWKNNASRQDDRLTKTVYSEKTKNFDISTKKEIVIS